MFKLVHLATPHPSPDSPPSWICSNLFTTSVSKHVVSIRLKYFLVLILFQYVYFLSYFQSGPIVLTVNVVEGRNLRPMDANGTGVNAV